MRYLSILYAFMCAATVFSAPLASPSTMEVSQDLEERQTPVAIAAEVTAIAKNIIEAGLDIWKLIQNIDDKIHQAESDFTRNMVARLRKNHPTMNVVVYHNPGSKYSFTKAQHTHYELDLPFLPTTQGYEVFIFESGSFQLSGDGGFENWCVDGKYHRSDDGKTVTFDKYK